MIGRLKFFVPLWLTLTTPLLGGQGLIAGASAFPARAVFGQTVVLVGTEANIAEGPRVYRWSVEESPTAVELEGNDQLVATFTAPETAGSYRFRFMATGAFTAASGTVTVEVAESGPEAGLAAGLTVCAEGGNQPATATVPAGIVVRGGSQATIEAQDGVDPDDTVIADPDPVSGVFYQWAVVQGAGLLQDEDLAGTDTAAVRFTAPPVNEETALAVALRVSDPAGCGTLYGVAVLVTPGPPVLTVEARIGDQVLPSGDRVVAGEQIALEAQIDPATSPAGVGQFSFNWEQIGGPEVELDRQGAAASFTAPPLDQAEVLTFEATAADGMDSVTATISLIAAPPDLFFSQVAFGPFQNLFFRTVLVLVNDRDTPAENVTVAFFDFDGNPLPLALDGNPLDPETPLVIEAGLSRSLALEAPAGVTTVGWGRVRSDVRLTGLVLYQLRESEALVSEVSLFSSPRARSFSTFFGRDDGLAIAAANPGAAVTQLSVRIVGEDGEATVLSTTLPLESTTQLARFLDASFFDAELPPDFERGTIIVESYDEPVIVTVLKTDAVGLAFSTLPVSTRPRPSNLRPVARLTYRIGAMGPFLEPDSSNPIAVSAPAEITLDAGLSVDPEEGPLNYAFSLETNLSSGGAVLEGVTETLRIVRIAEGTAGTVRVDLTVTDSGGLSDTISIVFNAS